MRHFKSQRRPLDQVVGLVDQPFWCAAEGEVDGVVGTCLADRIDLDQSLKPPQLAASLILSPTCNVASWHIASVRPPTQDGRSRLQSGPAQSVAACRRASAGPCRSAATRSHRARRASARAPRRVQGRLPSRFPSIASRWPVATRSWHRWARARAARREGRFPVMARMFVNP